MRKRSLARECSLKILYQADIIRLPIIQTTEKYWSEEETIDEDIYRFSVRLTTGIANNLDDIDAKISKYATNWQLKRMAIIDRNILRLGLYELQFASDIPPKVSINEAVELAKKYGDLESSKFVNGILDKIHKQELSSESASQNDKISS